MPIKLIINGAAGKMGQVAHQAFSVDPRFQLVGALGRTDDLLHHIRETAADVVLDLTRADVVEKNANIIIDAGARPVIGTTGLSTAQLHALTEKCASTGRGGLIVPNFSFGMLLLMRFAAEAARLFPAVEILEMHHTKKADAPSGSAIKTAKMIAEARTSAADIVTPGASRGAVHHEVPIHAMRLPGVLANQSVIFGGPGETLSLTHNTLDRQCFVPGMLLACERVMALQSLVYGLENVLPW